MPLCSSFTLFLRLIYKMLMFISAIYRCLLPIAYFLLALIPGYTALSIPPTAAPFPH